MVSAPMQLQGASATSQLNIQQVIRFYNTNCRLVYFIQRIICARVEIGFEKGLPSVKMPKGQSEQQ